MYNDWTCEEELFIVSGRIRGLGECEKVRVWTREFGGDLERNGCVADGVSGIKYNDLNRSFVVSLRNNERTQKPIAQTLPRFFERNSTSATAPHSQQIDVAVQTLLYC